MNSDVDGTVAKMMIDKMHHINHVKINICSRTLTLKIIVSDDRQMVNILKRDKITGWGNQNQRNIWP